MGPDASGSQPPKLAYHSSGSLSQYSFSRSSSVSLLAPDIRRHAITTQDATTIASPTNITIHMALPTERKVESRVTGGSSALNRSSSQFSDGVRKTDRPPGRVPIVIGRRLISKKGADPRHGRVVRADSRDRTPGGIQRFWSRRGDLVPTRRTNVKPAPAQATSLFCVLVRA